MNGLDRLSAPEINELLANRRYDRLREGLVGLEPADVADLVGELDGHQAAVVYRLLPHDLSAETFGYIDPERQQELIKNLGTERLVALINEMEPDDRTALLEELPATIAQRLIVLLTPEERRITQAIFGYPEVPPLLFHLTDDPGELANLAASEADRLRTLEELMRTQNEEALALYRRIGSGSESGEVVLSRLERERLEAFGYLVTPSSPAPAAPPP